MKNRIKELREKKNASQGDVAKALNTTCQAISQYETGMREPTLETWDKLADYFDVSIEYLMKIARKSPDFNPGMDRA